MDQERRRHGRLDVQLSCSYVAGELMGDGVLLDLSLGGARLRIPPPEGGGPLLEGALLLSLEAPEPEQPLDLEAEVTRVVKVRGGLELGLRFALLPPDTRERLEAALRALASQRSGALRAHARVNRRIALVCDSGEQLKATLQNVSRGGLALTVEPGIDVGGDELAVVLGTDAFPSVLRVQGEIVRREALPGGGARVALRFQPMGEAAQRRLDALVELLLGLAPRQAVFEPGAEEGEEPPPQPEPVIESGPPADPD